MTRDQKIALAVFGGIVGISIAGMVLVGELRSPENIQREKTRAAIAAGDAAAKIAAEKLRQDLAANKPAILAAALATKDTNPHEGIEKLNQYDRFNDADIDAARLELRGAIKGWKIANARRMNIAGEPAKAAYEIKEYAEHKSPELDKLRAEIEITWQKQRAQVAKDQAAAEKAELAQRKRNGVTIGMTQERVVQSSWGRPQSINRTITGTTVREQWVYPGLKNYLYFENGILTTIQN